MPHTVSRQLEDALRIWHAGVAALDPLRLMPEKIAVAGATLWIEPRDYDLRQLERIVVVGAGKAGAKMAVGLEQVLGEQILREKHVTGWVNVPADCLLPTQVIHLHAARPAGVNEPTPEGVAGAEKILERVSNLTERDLCICLLSGGGSALLPAPLPGVSLDTKVELAREIQSRGGNIQQLNTVRRELSRIKGGGLAAACRAGALHALVLSDVIGDDLETIASGPTVELERNPAAALEVLTAFDLLETRAGRAAAEVLRGLSVNWLADLRKPRPEIHNSLIGNNALAVDAAGIEAERLGYSHAMIAARKLEGSAESVARHLTDLAGEMRNQPGPDCLISGGETTVELCDPARRGLGGRNQQFALTGLAHQADWEEMALVSGGTDGEDGPTDAAGALVDASIQRHAAELGLDPKEFLACDDAYHFFEPLGALLKTGPTQTNVGDLRVYCLKLKR